MARKKKTTPNNNASVKAKQPTRKQTSKTADSTETKNNGKTNTVPKTHVSSNCDETKEVPTPSNSPKKQTGVHVDAMGSTIIKKTKPPNLSSTTMKVEGYAFHDDIVGVTHRRSDEEDAFNLRLRRMVLQKTLKDKGFGAYVTF